MGVLKGSLWHGAKNWTGQLKVQCAKTVARAIEPGLRLSTSVDDAKAQAGGGGHLMVVSFELDQLLQRAAVPVSDAIEWIVDNVRGDRQMRLVKHEVQRAADRYMAAKAGKGALLDERGIDDWFVPAVDLVSIIHLGGYSPAEKGIRLAQFFSRYRVDGSLIARPGGVQWVVVFNPAAVTGARRMSEERGQAEVGFCNLDRAA